MSDQSDLQKRLRFFGIDTETKRVVSDFLPILLPRMEAITDRFYGYTLNFPDAKSILAPFYANNTLRDRQVKHWIKLFSCRFDKEYYEYSLNFGKIHYKYKIIPYLYIGSYSFIQCELMNLVSIHYSDTDSRSATLAAINRLIALDMDLALSAYTREHWLSNDRQASPEYLTQSGTDTVFVC